jgi:phosphohistidine phosphatase
MKNLILIRHAKSSWKDPGLSDRDRPLNKRGKRDAPAMGRTLNERRLLPDLILSSPATRARKTAVKIAKAVGYDTERVTVDEQIYLQGLPGLLNLISCLDNGLQRVYLVGHNPDLTELANRLTGADIDNMPTCAVVSIEFPVESWRDCALMQGRMNLFLRPEKGLESLAGDDA